MDKPKGIIEQYRELQEAESRLLFEYVAVRERRLSIEKHLVIVTTLHGVVPVGRPELSKKVVYTPEALSDILVERLIQDWPGTLIERHNSRLTFKKWADEQRFHPTIVFRFEGERTQFIKVALICLRDKLEQRGVAWLSSGWDIFHNKERTLERMITDFDGVI